MRRWSLQLRPRTPRPDPLGMPPTSFALYDAIYARSHVTGEGFVVCQPNEQARRVYERVGFRHEGTLRRAHFLGGRNVDVHVMGLLAEELAEA